MRYYLNKDGKKVYTLKQLVDTEPTKEAHYKFIKYIEKEYESK